VSCFQCRGYNAAIEETFRLRVFDVPLRFNAECGEIHFYPLWIARLGVRMNHDPDTAENPYMYEYEKDRVIFPKINN